MNSAEILKGNAGARDTSTTDPSDSTIASRTTITTAATGGATSTIGTIAPTAPLTSKTTSTASTAKDVDPLGNFNDRIRVGDTEFTISTCKSLYATLPVRAGGTRYIAVKTVWAIATALAICTCGRVYICRDDANIIKAKKFLSRGVSHIKVRERERRCHQSDYRHGSLD
jgi:hypothetical protein